MGVQYCACVRVGGSVSAKLSLNIHNENNAKEVDEKSNFICVFIYFKTLIFV